MKCLSAVTILLLFLPSSGQSQTPVFPFHENFNRSIDDDKPVTWLSGGFPATLTQSNGDLILSDPTQLVPGEEGFSLGLTVVSKDDEFLMAGDTSAQTVVRVSAPNAFGSIYTRSQAGFPGNPGVPPGSDHGAYFGNIAGNGAIEVGSFSNQPPLVLETNLDPTTRDVVFQLDTIGNQVTASAWYADEHKPDSVPSITYTDSVARSPGVFGLSFGGFGDNATDVTATFRSFELLNGLPPGITGNPGLDGFIPPGLRNGLPSTSHHAVPEPTAAVLSLLGLTICCFMRRRY